MNLMLNNARFLHASLFLSLVLVSFTFWSCDQTGSPSAPTATSTNVLPTSIAPASGPTNWSGQPAFIQQAIAVQARHEASLLAIPGVIGDGIGLSKTKLNTAVILVFTSQTGVAGIPSSFEGIQTQTTMVGNVTAHAVYTGTYRSPLPCGVTVGDNDECASGSIGAIVTSSRTSSTNTTYGGAVTVYRNQYSWGSNTPKYMLSCNHVFANENSATGTNQQDQPGRYDVNCSTSGAVGKLHSWNFIKHTRNTTNYYDAALAECNPGLSGGWSPAMMSNASTTPYTLSYTPANTTVAPSVGMPIKKTGRTSGYNTGTIAGINVTITVGYTHFNAVFVDQIYVSNGTYIQAGDSGSMSVVNNSGGTNDGDPVGLDFAGSSSASFMNRMDHIANDFGLSFVQSSF
jgi:hypothetical protein